MTPGLYNIIWWLLRPLLPLVLRWRQQKDKEQAGRRQDRYGQPRFDAPLSSVIWLHSVSVGETIAAISLAKALAQTLPEAKFLITTNTVSAAKLVHREIATGFPLFHAFQPLDHPLFVDRFLAEIKPGIAIFMESDFWPNLVSRTAAKSIPVVFASSQLSTLAFRRWIRIPSLAKSVFAAPQLVLAVNTKQAHRFCQLGTPANRINVLGSLKLGNLLKIDKAFCRRFETAVAGRKILLAASTHEGEDAYVINAANALGNGWLTLIAPRHPHRGPDIAAICNKAPQRSLGQWPSADCNLYIMDSFGEMGSLFSLADLTILGGSFVPKGGHNPLEPAAFGLPIITGPHIFKNASEFAGLRDIGVVFDMTGCEGDPARAGQALADIATAIMKDRAQYRHIASAAKTYAATASKRSDNAAKMIAAIALAPQTIRE
jgi:3-deoxy-D-manno-octulosonic-acid transferase